MSRTERGNRIMDSLCDAIILQNQRQRDRDITMVLTVKTGSVESYLVFTVHLVYKDLVWKKVQALVVSVKFEQEFHLGVDCSATYGRVLTWLVIVLWKRSLHNLLRDSTERDALSLPPSPFSVLYLVYLSNCDKVWSVMEYVEWWLLLLFFHMDRSISYSRAEA